MPEEKKKKSAQSKHQTPSHQAAQPLPDAASQPPETASQKATLSPVSEVSSISGGSLAPPSGRAVSDAVIKVANAPGGSGDWRNHPFFFWFGMVGIVATLISVPLSVYFYQASQIAPLLTFAVHPLKTELQRPDFDKELGFTYKGKPLDSESITSIQVSVWNAGTRSIRDSEILDPFRLVMPDGSAILSVRATKISRPICAFESVGSQDNYKSGICPLKW